MTCQEDNCSTTSLNNSSTFSKQIIHLNVCAEYTYISLTVVAFLILPFNVCALWYASKTIHKGSKSIEVLSFNVVITSVLLFIPPVQLLFYFYLPMQSLISAANYIANTCIVAQAQFHTWICVAHYLAVS